MKNIFLQEKEEKGKVVKIKPEDFQYLFKSPTLNFNKHITGTKL